MNLLFWICMYNSLFSKKKVIDFNCNKLVEVYVWNVVCFMSLRKLAILSPRNNFVFWWTIRITSELYLGLGFCFYLGFRKQWQDIVAPKTR